MFADEIGPLLGASEALGRTTEVLMTRGPALGITTVAVWLVSRVVSEPHGVAAGMAVAGTSAVEGVAAAAVTTTVEFVAATTAVGPAATVSLDTAVRPTAAAAAVRPAATMSLGTAVRPTAAAAVRPAARISPAMAAVTPARTGKRHARQSNRRSAQSQFPLGH